VCVERAVWQGLAEQDASADGYDWFFGAALVGVEFEELRCWRVAICLAAHAGWRSARTMTPKPTWIRVVAAAATARVSVLSAIGAAAAR